MKIIEVCLLLTVILTDTDCNNNTTSSGPTVPSMPADVVVPLAIGNQWSTVINGWDSTGHPYVQANATTQISRDTIVQLERWFVWAPGTLVTERSNGFWLRTGSTPVQFLKYPAFIGDKYLCGSDTVVITSIDTTVTVTAGTFHCISYSRTNSGSTFVNQIVFAAPNKGIIQNYFYDITPGGHVFLSSRQDLIFYQLK